MTDVRIAIRTHSGDRVVSERVGTLPNSMLPDIAEHHSRETPAEQSIRSSLSF